MNTNIVLFDFDGTIVDSAPIIMQAVVDTLDELGLPPQSNEQLRAWVGPPLFHSFRDFAKVDPAHIDDAIATYRRYYRQTMYDAPFFPGVLEAIQELHKLGFPLAIATSKTETMAKPIATHAGLDPYFKYVVGSTNDSAHQSKAAVIADTLSLLEADGYNREGAIMIGDRIHDVEGAHANNLDVIGVLWGGTDQREFETATAAVATPAELVETVIERAKK